MGCPHTRIPRGEGFEYRFVEENVREWMDRGDWALVDSEEEGE